MEKTLEEKLAGLNPQDYDSPKDRELINSWKERVPMLAAQQGFKDHPITAELARITKEHIENIKAQLLSDEDMSELDRRVLIREKKLHEFYLGLFTKDPSAELQLIDKAVSLETE